MSADDKSQAKDIDSTDDAAHQTHVDVEENNSTEERPVGEIVVQEQEAGQSTKEDTSTATTAPVKRAEPKRRATEPASEEDSDEESEEEEVISNEGQEGRDDPMGEAYCLDDGTPIGETEEEVLPWRSDVKTPREFFNTEILYRYDILDPSEQEALKGSYRVELKGQDGGIWSIAVEDELSVDNTRNDAEIVLSLHHKDFMNIINGRLNPQLAILAQKIKVKGDTRRAIVFQSLLTPTPE